MDWIAIANMLEGILNADTLQEAKEYAEALIGILDLETEEIDGYIYVEGSDTERPDDDDEED